MNKLAVNKAKLTESEAETIMHTFQKFVDIGLDMHSSGELEVVGWWENIGNLIEVTPYLIKTIDDFEFGWTYYISVYESVGKRTYVFQKKDAEDEDRNEYKEFKDVGELSTWLWIFKLQDIIEDLRIVD